MLASAMDYIRPQEFIVFFVCALVWVLGGGHFYRKILGKRTERRKYSLGHGVLVSFLSGAGGGLAASLLYFIGSKIVPAEPTLGRIPISWLGAVLGIIGFFLVAYLVVFSMHKLTAKETFSTCILPIFVPVLFGVLAVGISLYFSSQSLQAKRKFLTLQSLTKNKMHYIHKVLEKNILKTGMVPISLDELVSKQILEPESITSPANPNGRGFFYNRSRAIADLSSREILLCDYKDNFGEKGRTVLYSGGYVEFLPEASFQARLKQPDNQTVAKALEAAEKK